MTMVAKGWSLHLPGVSVEQTVSAHLGKPRGDWARANAVEPDRAAALLGRKGLLAKEPATRLALCAVHRAFGLAPGRPGWSMSPDTAVVVAGNLGNAETVARVVRTVATDGGGAVSVLDAPNVSSNVIASAVALWFGFGGPNLMVCSGAGAGLDSLVLADLLLRTERARRVVLVGVEPADEVAVAVRGGRLTAGAACLVLEAPTRTGQPLVELVREDGRWPAPPRLVLGPGGFDLAPHWGDTYGAHGVVALALAAHLAIDEGHRVVAVRDVGDTRTRTALVTSFGCDGRPR